MNCFNFNKRRTNVGVLKPLTSSLYWWTPTHVVRFTYLLVFLSSVLDPEPTVQSSSTSPAITGSVSLHKALLEVTQLTCMQKAKAWTDPHHMSRNAIQRQNRVRQAVQHHSFHLQQPGHRNLSHWGSDCTTHIILTKHILQYTHIHTFYSCADLSYTSDLDVTRYNNTTTGSYIITCTVYEFDMKMMKTSWNELHHVFLFVCMWMRKVQPMQNVCCYILDKVLWFVYQQAFIYLYVTGLKPFFKWQ